MATPCRGDCKARQMIQLGAVIGCGSTAWPSRHGTGSTAWVRRLAAAPLVQRGDRPPQAGRGDCEAGGMIQLVFYCRVREHRLAVPTRDREHRLGAAARRQSLSRRSPTAPFAQGRSGGRTAILSLPRCTQRAFSVARRQDCTIAPSGRAGAPRPRAHTAGESMGAASRCPGVTG